jgi:hypothetical protein
MQRITFLALVCTIAIVLIEVNDGAPTTRKSVTTPTTVTTVKPVTTLKTVTAVKPVTVKIQPAVVKVDPKYKDIYINFYISLYFKTSR